MWPWSSLCFVISTFYSDSSFTICECKYKRSGWWICTHIISLIHRVFFALFVQMAHQLSRGNDVSVISAFRQAKTSIIPTLCIQILYVLCVIVGGVFLIIPGFLFWVWFFFTPIIAILDYRGVKHTFITSKTYVRGRFWSVLWRIIVLYVLFMVPSMLLGKFLPVAGIFWGILTPFFILFQVVLYQDVKGELQNLL
jgi:hypothetical protein